MLPDVPSTIVDPGPSRPWRSASSIIEIAGRSFTLPPGLRSSSFANSWHREVPAGAVEPDERGLADQVEQRVRRLDRRPLVGERDHLDPLEALYSCPAQHLVGVQLDRQTGLLELGRHLGRPRAHDADLSREAATEVCDQVRELLVRGALSQPGENVEPAFRGVLRLRRLQAHPCQPC